MTQPEKQRFLYNASATAFAGTVLEPHNEIIEGHAATCLSIDGGSSTAKSDGFNYRDIFSFASAITFLTGRRTENAWETLVTTEIQKLNILNVITADAVVAKLVSKQEHGKPNGEGKLIGPESTHLPLGSYFVNLRINGALVTTVPGEMCTEAFSTYSKAKRGRADEVIFDSVFENVSVENKSLSVEKNVITVPGFGRVTLGELIVLERERRLTMIHAELGSPVSANLSVAYSHGNGIPFPPNSK
jgi:hypothetical protein